MNSANHGAISPWMELWLTGAVVADPTFLATAATFGAAIMVWLVAWLRRRGDAGNADKAYGPVAGWADEGGRVDPRPYREFDLVAAFWITGIYILLSLSLLAAKALAVDAEPRTLGLGDLWTSIGFQGFMAVLVILVMTARMRTVDWLGLRWPGWRMVLALAPLSVVVMWLIFSFMQGVGYMRWMESMGVEMVQDSVRALQVREDGRVVALMIFAAVVVAPVCEEIVFRGFLYGVAKRFCGTLPAALGSALVFTAAHASLLTLLPLALFGLVLAWLYERTGSIWAPVAAHACFNTATVVVQLLIHR